MFISNIWSTITAPFQKFQSNKENPEVNSGGFNVSDTVNIGKKARAQKEWTLLVSAPTTKNLPDSFRKSIPLNISNTNIVAQFWHESGESQTPVKHYEVGPKNYSSTMYSYAPIYVQDSSDALQDFISYGIKNYPAKNYVIVIPNSDKVQEFTEESFKSEFASNPEIQKILSEKDSPSKLDVLEGFEAFAITSSDYLEKNNRNVANKIANTGHICATATGDNKVILDSEADALKQLFDEKGELGTFNAILESVQSNGLINRGVFKEYNLSLNELVCLKFYSLEGYRLFNKSLAVGSEKEIDSVRPLVNLTTDALDKLPPYEGTVYRATVLPENVLDEHKPGEEVSYKAFTSTSKYQGWKQDGFGKANTFLTIESSDKGKDISWLSEYTEEDEVLFPPDTSFTVLSHEKNKGYHYIHLREKSDTVMA